MRSKMPLRSLLLCVALLVLAACPPPPVDDDDATDPPCENDGSPTVLVQEIEDGQPAGFGVPVVAQVTDGDGISTVSLYYRQEGQLGFTFTFMSNDGTGSEDLYYAELPASVVQDPGVDYYVRATDAVAGCQEETLEPPAAPEEWLNFAVDLERRILPLYESFEPGGDCGEEGYELDELGWQSSIEGFLQSIHAWRLDDRSPLSGSCSASHSEGIPGGFWECPPPEGDGSIERQNWLISPPMDFRDKTEIAVRWFERHVEAGACAELHALYVSVGSPDPADGDYVLVADVLPFPGSAWESSDWYDVSDLAGEEQVYLALYYQGGAAGRWQIDDFYVGEPLADLQLDEAGPLDSAVGPGSSAVALDVSVVNVSDTYSAGALTATLETADPFLTITAGSSSVPALGPLESASIETAFVFNVGAAHPDNSYLDFAMTLDDGDGHVWTVPIRLLMGVESSVSVEVSGVDSATVDLEVGYGSLEVPDFAVAASGFSPLESPWTLAITEEAASLPPGPGSFRWYLRASNTGELPATVADLVFTVGGVEYRAEPEDVPVTLEPGSSAVILVPPPPVLEVESWVVTPDPAAPGGAVSITSLTIHNSGSTTAGPLNCIMGSSNADASGFATSPVSFGVDPVGSDSSAVADDSFDFDIDAGHTDNTPIPLTLLCTDGADTLVANFDLEVPYAHPVTESVRIDDAAGNVDGFADPGEVVDVYLTALNDGAFETDGPVEVSVSLGSGSSAVFTLSALDPLDFGTDPLASGESRESTNSFQLSVDSSALLGDTMVLALEYSSGADTWTESLEIDVTGLPWIDCSVEDDLEGDSLGGSSGFDIQSCSFRSDDTMLQVRLHSWLGFDASVLFMDVFFYEVPSMYTLESVGGSAAFEDGCVFGDDLETSVPVAVATSGQSATARLALEDIGDIGGSTLVAFGTGSCPDVFFCDTYPPGALDFNIAEGQYTCDGNQFIPISW